MAWKKKLLSFVQPRRQTKMSNQQERRASNWSRVSGLALTPPASTLFPFTTSQLLKQHSPLKQHSHRYRPTDQTPPYTPFYFNPSPEKRTATAFYVRLDRKPQVLRYVHRISPLRQAQTNCLPASTRSLGCLLPSHPAYVQPMRWCLHQVFTMFAGRESDLTPDRRRHA